MNCPECRNVVADTAAACPNCGCPIDSANEFVLKVGAVTFTNVNAKDMAAAIAGNLAGGNLVSGIPGRRVFNAASRNLGKNGHGVLTNKRFVFGNSRALKKTAEGSAVSFAAQRAKGDIDFDIPLEVITSVSEGKQGFSALFAIDTYDGEYKFALLKKSQLPEWMAAFQRAGK